MSSTYKGDAHIRALYSHKPNWLPHSHVMIHAQPNWRPYLIEDYWIPYCDLNFLSNKLSHQYNSRKSHRFSSFSVFSITSRRSNHDKYSTKICSDGTRNRLCTGITYSNTHNTSVIRCCQCVREQVRGGACIVVRCEVCFVVCDGGCEYAHVDHLHIHTSIVQYRASCESMRYDERVARVRASYESIRYDECLVRVWLYDEYTYYLQYDECVVRVWIYDVHIYYLQYDECVVRVWIYDVCTYHVQYNVSCRLQNAVLRVNRKCRVSIHMSYCNDRFRGCLSYYIKYYGVHNDISNAQYVILKFKYRNKTADICNIKIFHSKTYHHINSQYQNIHKNVGFVVFPCIFRSGRYVHVGRKVLTIAKPIITKNKYLLSRCKDVGQQSISSWFPVIPYYALSNPDGLYVLFTEGRLPGPRYVHVSEIAHRFLHSFYPYYYIHEVNKLTNNTHYGQNRSIGNSNLTNFFKYYFFPYKKPTAPNHLVIHPKIRNFYDPLCHLLSTNLSKAPYVTTTSRESPAKVNLNLPLNYMGRARSRRTDGASTRGDSGVEFRTKLGVVHYHPQFVEQVVDQFRITHVAVDRSTDGIGVSQERLTELGVLQCLDRDDTCNMMIGKGQEVAATSQRWLIVHPLREGVEQLSSTLDSLHKLDQSVSVYVLITFPAYPVRTANWQPLLQCGLRGNKDLVRFTRAVHVMDPPIPVVRAIKGKGGQTREMPDTQAQAFLIELETGDINGTFGPFVSTPWIPNSVSYDTDVKELWFETNIELPENTLRNLQEVAAGPKRPIRTQSFGRSKNNEQYAYRVFYNEELDLYEAVDSVKSRLKAEDIWATFCSPDIFNANGSIKVSASSRDLIDKILWQIDPQDGDFIVFITPTSFLCFGERMSLLFIGNAVNHVRSQIADDSERIYPPVAWLLDADGKGFEQRSVLVELPFAVTAKGVPVHLSEQECLTLFTKIFTSFRAPVPVACVRMMKYGSVDNVVRMVFSDSNDVPRITGLNFVNAVVDKCPAGIGFEICKGKITDLPPFVADYMEITDCCARLMDEPNCLNMLESPVTIGGTAVFYQHNLLDEQHIFSEQSFRLLMDLIRIKGYQRDSGRVDILVGFQDVKYKYDGQVMTPHPWNMVPGMARMITQVQENACKHIGKFTYFNAMIVTLLSTPQDYLPDHSDNNNRDTIHEPDSYIVNFSLGGTRWMQFVDLSKNLLLFHNDMTAWHSSSTIKHGVMRAFSGNNVRISFSLRELVLPTSKRHRLIPVDEDESPMQEGSMEEEWHDTSDGATDNANDVGIGNQSISDSPLISEHPSVAPVSNPDQSSIFYHPTQQVRQNVAGTVRSVPEGGHNNSPPYRRQRGPSAPVPL